MNTVWTKRGTSVDKIKAIIAGLGIVTLLVGAVWMSNTLERLEELEQLTVMQNAALQQKDAVIAAERANIDTLKALAKHKEDFENGLIEFMGKTDKQLKEVLANDKTASDWWNVPIPDSVLRMQWAKSGDTNGNNKAPAAAR